MQIEMGLLIGMTLSVWHAAIGENDPPRIPPGLEKVFERPSGPQDALGNPVRTESDEVTGWPFEICHKPTGMVFVLIPAGKFLMGSPKEEKGRDRDEGPVHPVRISKPYYLGKYEVTRGEWKKTMGSEPPDLRTDAGPDMQQPVSSVSWHACQGFIARLNIGLGQDQGLKFALPTEAQWEYACRAGTTTRFPHGDDPKYTELENCAWFSRFVIHSGKVIEMGETSSSVVGELQPNPWGLYDMHGNILEWCEVFYDAYSAADAVDPAGPPTGEYRVLRGGSWFDGPESCRCANRGRAEPTESWRHFGLRLSLREVVPPPAAPAAGSKGQKSSE